MRGCGCSSEADTQPALISESGPHFLPPGKMPAKITRAPAGHDRRARCDTDPCGQPGLPAGLGWPASPAHPAICRPRGCTLESGVGCEVSWDRVAPETSPGAERIVGFPLTRSDARPMAARRLSVRG